MEIKVNPIVDDKLMILGVDSKNKIEYFIDVANNDYYSRSVIVKKNYGLSLVVALASITIVLNPNISSNQLIPVFMVIVALIFGSLTYLLYKPILKKLHYSEEGRELKKMEIDETIAKRILEMNRKQNSRIIFTIPFLILLAFAIFVFFLNNHNIILYLLGLFITFITAITIATKDRYYGLS